MKIHFSKLKLYKDLGFSIQRRNKQVGDLSGFQSKYSKNGSGESRLYIANMPQCALFILNAY